MSLVSDRLHRLLNHLLLATRHLEIHAGIAPGFLTDWLQMLRIFRVFFIHWSYTPAAFIASIHLITVSDQGDRYLVRLAKQPQNLDHHRTRQ